MDHIANARIEIAIEAKEAALSFTSRNEVLDTLEKFPGSYEALVEFAGECLPVEDGEYHDWNTHSI